MKLKAEDLKMGPELDTLIAEKVMGFQWRALAPDDPLGRWQSPDGQYWSAEPPGYSTSMELAWQVVEAIKARGFHWWFTAKVGEDQSCTAAIRTMPESNTIACCRSAAMSEAICLSALKAIGVIE